MGCFTSHNAFAVCCEDTRTTLRNRLINRLLNLQTTYQWTGSHFQEQRPNFLSEINLIRQGRLTKTRNLKTESTYKLGDDSEHAKKGVGLDN